MFSANSSQVSEDRLFVEDVFSTYLYSGTSGAQSINNGIDILNKGGLVWLKNRTSALNNILIDTAQGCTFAGGKGLVSNSTAAPFTVAANTFQFDSTGFSFGSAATGTAINGSGSNYASWSFREAPKFFDIVTWTGDGTTLRTLSHSLSIAPGVIIAKPLTGGASNWYVYHRGMTNSNTSWLELNTTTARQETGGSGSWNPTATTFTVDDFNFSLNNSGLQYIAYLFAHDTTSDGIIQCGSYTGTGSDLTVNLGWEPQWWLVKNTTTAGWSWSILDNMRGFSAASDNILQPNSSNAELTTTNISLTPTGVEYASTGNGAFNSSGATYIYVAIRRGPMRTPTLGTSVFSPQAVTLSTVSNTIVSSDTAGPMDVVINQQRSASGGGGITQSRLTGGNYLITSSTGAETSGSYTNWDRMTGTKPTPWTDGQPVAAWQFRRAPSFLDEVCYTGTGSARTVNHNLGVAPELMIVKVRNSGTYGWFVYAASQGATKFGRLDLTNAFSTASTVWNDTAPTASVFSLGAASGVNDAFNYVAYLFASCPGVSKVGSYTGNGSSQTINCGFAAGARFVMIKRTDSTGDWYVWDTARGIVAGNDPHLSLNSTAAEVTTDDSVDTDSSGFVVNQLSATNINVNAATYLYMAVA